MNMEFRDRNYLRILAPGKGAGAGGVHPLLHRREHPSACTAVPSLDILLQFRTASSGKSTYLPHKPAQLAWAGFCILAAGHWVWFTYMQVDFNFETAGFQWFGESETAGPGGVDSIRYR